MFIEWNGYSYEIVFYLVCIPFLEYSPTKRNRRNKMVFLKKLLNFLLEKILNFYGSMKLDNLNITLILVFIRSIRLSFMIASSLNRLMLEVHFVFFQ